MLNKALILAYTKERNLSADKIIQEFDPSPAKLSKTPGR